MISSKCNLTIDLNVIKKNYEILQKICIPSEVGAVVKANCYGLGVEKIAPILADSGCKYFFVANKDEGIVLRKTFSKGKFKYNNLNICVLNGYFIADKDDFIKYNLIPVLNSLQQLKFWKKVAFQKKEKLPCFLHLDTGTNRLGIPAEEINFLQKENEVNILCVMSHLSCSNTINSNTNKEQLIKFKELTSFFPDAKKSLVNSSGIFLGIEYHFDITRPGIAIYGGSNPAAFIQSGARTSLGSPLTLEAPILQIKYLDKGEYVGYNRTYKLEKEHIIAVLPLGYADGYPVSLSNKGVVFINNRAVRVIGNVSMDLTTIDVSEIPEQELFLGQMVEIIGKNINISGLADLAGISSYEIMIMLGNRYNRIYK